MSPFRRSLQASILFLVLLLLALGFGATALFTIESERRNLIAQMTERAAILASTIHKSIRSNMREGRPDIARSLIDELKRQEGVMALQVFRVDGSEAFTDLRTLEKVSSGRIQLDDRVVESIRQQASHLKNMESLKNNSYFKEAIVTGKNISWMSEVSENGGKAVRVLTFLKPLENEPDCQICHGSDSKLRGIVRVSTDISGLEERTASLRNRQITIAVTTLIVVSAVLILFLRRRVVIPIQELAEIAERLGQGEFDATLTYSGEDEIGRLGASFRDMAASLSSAYNDLQAKNADLERTLEELRESHKKVKLLEAVKDQLTKFVPESVKRLLEENPEADTLEKKDKDVTVLFLDIEGYTLMGEIFPQDIVNNVIERYFSAFLDIVNEFKGDINETAGDGLMIIFQDDDPMKHAANAVEASIKMRARAIEFDDNRQSGFPCVRTNIGINSGVATVGAHKFETPSGQARWTFTASGPVTNHASRIGAEATGGRIFIGPETARRVKDRYALIDMGEHSLKNISAPLQILQVVPTGTIFPKSTFDPIDALKQLGDEEETVLPPLRAANSS